MAIPLFFLGAQDHFSAGDHLLDQHTFELLNPGKLIPRAFESIHAVYTHDDAANVALVRNGLAPAANTANNRNAMSYNSTLNIDNPTPSK